MTVMKPSMRQRLLQAGLILLVLTALGLTGCATTPVTLDSQHKPAEAIYTEGRAALQAEDYPLASSHFKSLEIYYPDSPYNHQAQMELAYAYFKSGDYSSTIATTDRLIRNFPNSDNHDYPRYLKALAGFEQAVTLIETDGNQENALLSAQTALQYFEELTTHSPNSKYQQDANKRVAYLQEQLAQHEVAIARSMIEQGNHASAVVHARNVVENYPQTRSAADALAIVDMGYEIMAIENADTETSPQQPVTIPTVISAAVPRVTEALHDDTPTPAATMAAPGNPAGTHTTAWILLQPEDHYSIQLISTTQADTLSHFIRNNKLDDRVAYYRKQINGKTWHALIYGSYPSAGAARAALAELPEALNKGKPWVLSIRSIQKNINDFAATH